MSIKIERNIVDYNVVKPDDAQSATPAVAETPAPDAPRATVTRMHEKVERPEMLVGNTYKIKPPVSDHAFYITINDMVLNPGTPYEKRRPFEIFINSKNMDHYQWISALTRIISAVFRKGGDVAFLVQELQSIFDPKGGYFRRGGRYMPSLVAEIGDAIESHLRMIGLIDAPVLDKHQQQLVDQKRAEFARQQTLGQQALNADDDESAFPAGATLCGKCHNKAMIVLDNCLTCLNCGESKCS
ncbi:MAG: NrdJb [bacterium]